MPCSTKYRLRYGIVHSRATSMRNVSTYPNSLYSPSTLRSAPNHALVDVLQGPEVAHDRSGGPIVGWAIGATKDTQVHSPLYSTCSRLTPFHCRSDQEPEPEPHVNAHPLSTREGKGKGRALPDGRIRTRASSSRSSDRIRKNRAEVVYKPQYDPAPSVLIQEIRR